jgi:hypothetical protein
VGNDCITIPLGATPTAGEVIAGIAPSGVLDAGCFEAGASGAGGDEPDRAAADRRGEIPPAVVATRL